MYGIYVCGLSYILSEWVIYIESPVLAGFDTVHHSNCFSRGGRGGRGGFRRGDGYNRRGGPPGERGNRRGRGGYGGPPRGGRGGGFGQQQVCRCQFWFVMLINLSRYMLKPNPG